MKKLIYLLFLLAPVAGFAQQEGTFYFMNTVSQSGAYNPAFTPKYNTTVGLPVISSIYGMLSNSGFAYSDLFTRREDDSLVAMPDNLYKVLKDRNHIQSQFNVDLFHLSFKLNPRMHFTFNIAEKNIGRSTFSKDIADLLINGNAQFIGQEKVAIFEMNGLAYLDMGMGLNYKVNEMITAGARFKVLKGLANAYTERADLTIKTGDNYQIDITGDALIHAGGITDDVEKFSEFKELAKNNGVAVDLGVTFKPIDKLTLGLSVTDLGGIKWKNGLKSYTLDPAKAHFTFKGIDIAKAIDDEASFDDELDSLEENFEFVEREGDSHRTALPTRLYLSGSYELAHQLYTSLLFSGVKYNQDVDLSVTANVSKNVGKALSLGVSYTANSYSCNNWGAGISFNLAPLQIYFAGDNILGAAASSAFKGDISPYVNNLQYFNFRFGVNFIGGWEKTAEKLSDDSF